MVRLLPLLLGTAALAAPADRVPTPQPEPCIPFDAEPEGDHSIAVEQVLSYDEVKQSLGTVISAALYCGQPSGFSSVHLTFDLMVGCDGLVSEIEAIDTGGAPESYVSCVSDVIAKADFPAHQRQGGMLVTYPVNVNW